MIWRRWEVVIMFPDGREWARKRCWTRRGAENYAAFIEELRFWGTEIEIRRVV